jgi:hypothetical protein
MFTQIMNTTDPFLQLRKSEFRRSFHLTPIERSMVAEKGFQEMRDFVYHVIDTRLNAPFSDDDGHQTPKSGHPVFIAQHATATCCRKCMFRWHRIPRHRELTDDEKTFVAGLVLRWIKKDIQVPLDQIREERKVQLRKFVKAQTRAPIRSRYRMRARFHNPTSQYDEVLLPSFKSAVDVAH